MLTLAEYTREATRIVKWYINRQYPRDYRIIKTEDRYFRISLMDDDVIGKCTTRLIKAEQKYKSGKSKLSLEKYKRMHVIYQLRAVIQNRVKIAQRYPTLLPRDDYPSKTKSVSEVYEEKEEKENMLVALKKSKLDKKHKKFTREFLKGKSIIDIAHENRTTSPVVKRIILQSTLQLKEQKK